MGSLKKGALGVNNQIVDNDESAVSEDEKNLVWWKNIAKKLFPDAADLTVTYEKGFERNKNSWTYHRHELFMQYSPYFPVQ